MKPTETTHWQLDNDQITVEVENTTEHLRWRMTVNGDQSRVTGYYAGILKHKGYGLATAYWEGTLPVFQPFRITPTMRIES